MQTHQDGFQGSASTRACIATHDMDVTCDKISIVNILVMSSFFSATMSVYRREFWTSVMRDICVGGTTRGTWISRIVTTRSPVSSSTYSIGSDFQYILFSATSLQKTSDE